jgi:glucose dehydrogenase
VAALYDPGAERTGREDLAGTDVPPRGGHPWVTGTYDAETDTLLWGVGHPSPWLSDQRRGRNLYTDSVVGFSEAKRTNYRSRSN